MTLASDIKTLRGKLAKDVEVKEASLKKLATEAEAATKRYTDASVEAAQLRAELENFEHANAALLGIKVTAPKANHKAPPAKTTSTKAKSEPVKATPKKATASASTKASADEGEFLLGSDGKPVLKKDGTPRRRPGPSKGAKLGPRTAETKAASKAPTKAVAKTVAKTASKTPAAKKTAKKAEPKKSISTSGKKRAAEGRRAVASGARPKIKDAIAQVMSSDEMGISDVVDALKKKGWLPNSANSKTYVGYILSATKELFERVPSKRGVYRVKGGTATKLPKSHVNGTSHADKVIAEAGILSGEGFANPG